MTVPSGGRGAEPEARSGGAQPEALAAPTAASDLPPTSLAAEYRTTIDALFDAVHVVDAELRIVLINQAFEQWLARLGLPGDVVGKSVFEVFPFLPDRVRGEYQQVLERGTAVVTREAVQVGGEHLQSETRKIPVVADGRVVRVVTVVRDISGIEQTAAALRQSEENYRRLVEVSPVGLAVHQKGRIIYANSAALKIVGARHADEVVGRAVLDFVHPDFVGSVRERIAALDESADMPPFEEQFVRLDGSTVHVLVTGAVLTFRGSPAVQVLFQDISEQKAAEEQRRQMHAQVERAQRLESLGALAGGIAHDFNNLLTAILGRVELARVQVGSDELRELLLEAERAGDEAVALTRQLLTFAKGGAPVRQAARLGPLAQETTSFCVRGRPVDVVFDLHDRRHAKIDTGQIQQVVQNIVLNALDAMPRGGELRIATADVTEEDRSWIELRATDSGSGISAAALDRVFEPYFTTKPTGSGLGLAVVHSIVRQHEGRVSVTSSPGQGTTVRVLLPAAERTTGAPAPRPSRVPPQGLRVLVMDDDPSVRQVVEDMLHAAGHSAVTVADGKAAIDAYAAAAQADDQFDAVVLDLTVRRGMGGREAAAEICKLDPNAPLIVSSGYSDDPVFARARDHGFVATLPKPFSLPTLLETLATVVLAARKRR